ncbi:carboxymuconolactone decarboxylase family protein [Enterovibrio norvegicus]|uniref:carboxymuconolactone decarboxylase family protein n=1 Tax=Enterovibrio norvegicus TaxID=188144 RepID=UPI000314AF2B|nr:carboxymuconolactone decarboxylase family protein [Enterovibrio norvegicus]OEE69291.1 carboxymuconolactone decarboxylase [Enterovibrio norvegicus]PMH70386.1 carboxymuconolactone decarboxylase [Enterovibrio norvegicus]TKF33969.1 carboxymuconolactone decarboxylase [Enterovibrio norvegicus]
MAKINPVNVAEANTQQKALFDEIHGAFGAVPNMFKTIGHSAPALESMWTSFGALGKGKLGAKLGEQIAVLVADINRCEYCLAAHTLLGQNAGVSLEQMQSAQRGEGSDPKTQAALDFAVKLVKQHGQVSADDVQRVRDAGYSDGDIAEILAHVALNIFTNYTNVAFDVEVDFPKVSLT